MHDFTYILTRRRGANAARTQLGRPIPTAYPRSTYDFFYILSRFRTSSTYALKAVAVGLGWDAHLLSS